ncbi:sensor histidine kinase [Pseudoduganella armeniaca]|uniref:histidine kinase n=1 Tax=Pseudoduganella armeniaca TaxID=2072590 RepID=A0A2R4CCI4_9BURK|nr:sensor histidine kinase [Pseudoduganella armeniaca]AVR97272.1 sensor histidine kinase [Pseudoduganella armeniaca]
MASIRVRLLRWLIGPILLVHLAGGALVYALAWLPAQQAFDQGLLDTAHAVAASPRPAWQAPRGGDSEAVYLAVRDPAGRLLAGDRDLPRVAAYGQVVDALVRAEPVRLAQLRTPQGTTVTLAKTLRQRGQAQAAIVRALLLLEAVLTLVSAALVWYAVTRGLRPLRHLRVALRARTADDVAPLAMDDVPAELEPVVRAVNGLLEQSAQGARARQDFLANMAHQLRTPLAGLQAQLDVLARGRAGTDDAATLALMRAATQRMTRQVSQLLALARAEPGQSGGRRPERVGLDQLLGESVQQFVEQAVAKHIDLGFELAPATVQGDRFQLRDLADNLIDNALRYTPTGGRVTVSCGRDVDGAFVSVEDNGPGIPPALRTAVFSRFVRLDEHSAGTGIGLAIVREIAAAHGARVDIDTSAGGQGARFIVRFPGVN